MKNMRFVKLPLPVVIVFVFVITVVILFFRELLVPLSIESNAIVIVKPGASLRMVIDDLEERGALKERIFPSYWIARGYLFRNYIKYGEYKIVIKDNLKNFLDRLTRTEETLHRLTVVEGWTFRKLLKAIEKHPKISKTLVKKVTAKEAMIALGHPEKGAEGLFFPDTYLFRSKTTDIAVLREAFDRMKVILDKAWQEKAEGLPYRSPYEALIMASIIEKEAFLREEKPRIAGVFIQRLRIGMPLQTDPSVIYGLRDDFNGNLTRKDLAKEGRYNTYLYTGLPPTPISLPGKDSIYAALHPEIDGSIYFVAKGDGSHHFSSSLAEHNCAVTLYQKKKNTRCLKRFRP